MPYTVRVKVGGLVQGIGYRPFVHRTALKYGVLGYVRNMGDVGVEIVAQGDKKDVDRFVHALKEEKPWLCTYSFFKVEVLEESPVYSGFEIIKSSFKGSGRGVSYIPPDITVCDECLREIDDPSDRHYLYAFTCCAQCGPRFTVIRDVPYDRERTSMDKFPMCDDCRREFYDVRDRRYNAQTICCPNCGPRLWLTDGGETLASDVEALRLTARLLDEGFIVAIKGIGGCHLACKTTDNDAVNRLRQRRRKPQKPFAVMSPDIEAVLTYADPSEREIRLLESFRRPIVVVRKKTPFPLSRYVSPGLDSIGVMLPYSGIHHLILKWGAEPAYVMTSGNMPGLPMATSNRDILKTLSGVADYFLLHDREIVNRCDDSVVKIVGGETAFIRRSRGYVPEPITLNESFRDTEAIAVGPLEASTCAVMSSGRAYLSQHIGDVETLQGLEFLESSLRHLMKIFKVRKPSLVASDLHPGFPSTDLAHKLSVEMEAPHVKVQHHHAHMAALMAENKLPLDSVIVCITADGYGYGPKGEAWGGEILLGGYSWYMRAGSLKEYPLPGGDTAARRYGWIVAGLLHGEVESEALRKLLMKRCINGFKHGLVEVDVVLGILDSGSYMRTSSCGRFLDAAACILGVACSRTYRGEGAIKLEAAASNGDPERVEFKLDYVNEGGVLKLDTRSLFIQLLDALKENIPRRHIAAAVHKALGQGFAYIASFVADDRGIPLVGFSGGVAYNRLIVGHVKCEMEKDKLKILLHRHIPPGDGGISLGQLVAACTKQAI